MLYDESKIAQKFELEVWMYLENQLSPTEQKYWDEKIANSNELKTILNEAKSVLNLYNSETLHDIEDPLFDKMIAKATSRRLKIIDRIKNILIGSENEFGLSRTKIAFGSLLTVAAVVMFLMSEKPNSVKRISSELLDWEATSISEQLEEIDGGISLIEDDKLKQYLYYKKTNDKWTRDLYKIKSEIKELLDETEERSL